MLENERHNVLSIPVHLISSRQYWCHPHLQSFRLLIFNMSCFCAEQVDTHVVSQTLVGTAVGALLKLIKSTPKQVVERYIGQLMGRLQEQAKAAKEQAHSIAEALLMAPSSKKYISTFIQNWKRGVRRVAMGTFLLGVINQLTKNVMKGIMGGPAFHGRRPRLHLKSTNGTATVRCSSNIKGK